jgi:UDP-3-O-[3-hydroxymyristoyl] glucosamine N-acyltransferase
VNRSYSLAELAAILGAELSGDAHHQIRALATLQTAGSSDLSFIANPAYKKFLADSCAGAVLIHPELASEFSGNKLLLSNPYVGYARLSALFDTAPVAPAGIDPSAALGPNVTLGAGVCVGANAVVAEGVSLGDGVIVGPGSFVGANSIIGARTRLAANVSIYHGISIGEECIFHSGTVIGADGFGFAPTATGWVKIHQLGSVIIGNKVEIGANSCIDRGALDNTCLDDGVIIDNLVQIGHNVRIGKNTAVAAHTAIAGSTTIGDNCTIAGAVAIAGHLTLVDGVHITGMSMVSGSIMQAGSYSSGVPLAPTKDWRKNAARFRQLDALATRLIKLERQRDAD